MILSTNIEEVWGFLYSMNPKIQRFGIIKDTKVLWQTSNWDLVDDVEVIVNAPIEALERIEIDRIPYDRVTSSVESYIGTASGNRGHVIIAKIKNKLWLVIWAEATSIPDLTYIDVAYTATRLEAIL